MALALAIAVLGSRTANAQDGGIWPAPLAVPRDQLANPMYWPNDPEWAVALPGNDGQYQMYSWMPPAVVAAGMIRPEEIALGSGNNTDAAWQLTIGDPRVLIAVIDSGIEWDTTDLQLKAALNPGELPRPQIDAGGTIAASYDANGDGVFNVADYLRDPRIVCGVALPHPLRGCMDAMGHPNDANANGVLDAGDLIRTFSDGTDADGNGYVDDISGWDFFKDDNDPYDDTRYGHGTGEAKDSAAETNNGIGGAGNCPRCMFVPLRAGDSFLTSDGDFAQAVLYAADLHFADVGYGSSRVRVIQEAMATFNSDLVARAMDYAYGRNVLLVNTAADENSRHQMFPGANNHTLVVHAVKYDGGDLTTSRSVLAFNNCTNYGAQLHLSVEGNSCSSEAVGQSSGIAGLVASLALQRSLTPELSAEEARQLLIESADDINIPESVPGAPGYNPNWYPSLPGWDQRFGYGRINARRAVEWLRDGRIPPEVDVTTPRWFTYFNPSRAASAQLTVGGRVTAPRAQSYDVTVEWAAGIEPASSAFHTISQRSSVTAPTLGTLATLDLSSIQIDNAGEPENRFTITVRVRAVAHYSTGGSSFDVPGEARRVFYVVRDPDLLDGFPIDVHASGEASPHLADVDEDGHVDIVFPTASGLVRAVRSDGTEARGFPVHTDAAWGYGGRAGEPDYRRAPAYSGAMPAIDPSTIFEPVTAAAGIADLDGDGHAEVVVAGYQGGIYVFKHDGTPFGHGFPLRLPAVPSAMTSPDARLDRGVTGSVVLADLDGDSHPEIVVGGFDGVLYAFDAATAAPHPGFPVTLHNTTQPTRRNRIFGGITVGRFDSDSVPDLLVASNEELLSNEGTGAIFLVHGNGNAHAGGPMHPHWPIVIESVHVLPEIGEGIANPLPAADFDGDGIDDIALYGTGQPLMTLSHTTLLRDYAQPAAVDELPRILSIRSLSRGSRSDAHAPPFFVTTLHAGALGDLNADGTPDFTIDGASSSILNNVSGAGRTLYEHQLGAWDGRSGNWLPGFPKVVEDFGFLSGPVIADLSGDGYPEVAVGTGGFYLHAVDGCGHEAPGFPKFTGQWNMAAPAIGDIDGDGALEITANTRNGWLFAWRTHGRADGVQPWPSWRHDNANTGNYGTALPVGIRRMPGLAPLNCPAPMMDAGVSDASQADASLASDATAHDVGLDGDGGPRVVSGGCGCRVVGHTGGAGDPSVAQIAIALAATIIARRPRARGIRQTTTRDCQ